MKASTEGSPTPPDSSREGTSALLAELLESTSRTFALAIPLLPAAMERQVRLAYLLFRIADTFEDATVLWSRAERVGALHSFAELMRQPSHDDGVRLAAEWLRRPPSEHEGYCRLVSETPAVLGELDAVDAAAAGLIRRHTIRTALGMAAFVDRADDEGVLELADLADLQAYCYVVAGIVGEMLTDLFILGSPALAGVASDLRERAASFGEGLQLTNILRDAAGDRREGRVFLPAEVDRGWVFDLARRDLTAAMEYSIAAQRAGGPDGVVSFTALTVGLAVPTLERVERHGPGSKISRARVFRIYNRIQHAIGAGLPVFDL